MDQGFTFLKQDFGINLLKDVPGRADEAASAWTSPAATP